MHGNKVSLAQSDKVQQPVRVWVPCTHTDDQQRLLAPLAGGLQSVIVGQLRQLQQVHRHEDPDEVCDKVQQRVRVGVPRTLRVHHERLLAARAGALRRVVVERIQRVQRVHRDEDADEACHALQQRVRLGMPRPLQLNHKRVREPARACALRRVIMVIVELRPVQRRRDTHQESHEAQQRVRQWVPLAPRVWLVLEDRSCRLQSGWVGLVVGVRALRRQAWEPDAHPLNHSEQEQLRGKVPRAIREPLM